MTKRWGTLVGFICCSYSGVGILTETRGTGEWRIVQSRCKYVWYCGELRYGPHREGIFGTTTSFSSHYFPYCSLFACNNGENCLQSLSGRNLFVDVNPTVSEISGVLKRPPIHRSGTAGSVSYCILLSNMAEGFFWSLRRAY